MQPRTLAELAHQVGGTVHGPGTATVGPDVVIDSRRAGAGALFVALRGEQVDGHDYAAAAAANGAAAVLGQRPTELPTVVVDDAVAALGRLGRACVDAVPGLTVLAVTGSSGKTSTKDLLAQVLEPAGECVAPEGNHNNEIGVPLTATRVGPGTRFLVSEMGARGVGHIAYLCTLTPPDVAIALNVGTAHLGEFGGRDAVARAKGEIVASLDPDGWAVLNADDERVLAMRERTRGRVALFALDARPPQPADRAVWATDVRAAEAGRYRFTLHCADAEGEDACEVALVGVGRHQVANALAAATAARCAGLALPAIGAALSTASSRSRWRMEVATRDDGVVVLNDSYNANPESMRAALAVASELVAEQRRSRPGARLVAVLGDMLELGESTTEEHIRLGADARAAGVDELVVLGDQAAEVLAGFAGPSGRGRRPEVDVPATVLQAPGQVAGLLEPRLAAGDVVLVKASRSLQLQTAAEELVRGTQTQRREKE
ncbi:UDP-N-acetylmuramoyl-tripeptide--D-alanyl-D-alanine ligase [Desertihabitans brevis]|uniref:UDP-N-acetylmuramoyl-tripeptide--D-alanyl-D-alanine ligase n=1 Tax=Desertihabitans brevis TaxID=2268447 RepID=A0A367YY01_9ACTN|nr:UDP-N-acetylmuramoyl-tripeptide--D-alanyl-D-alanine ligase [Desertihabitans brevis]